ncbi:hypothetical protein MSI_05100 [Treponema sp. JC4]|uniref:DUF4392 domain-containing protein n=1 Tax=Treponema sp. JC4 TaxID=1124982 RepID=UPI00025B04AA|nr:DUF4392 domain-containing protein [Treponema sp. JC4]EID85691.1 hypothetical protein MSI_05100 [Treponema sp. JC4]
MEEVIQEELIEDIVLRHSGRGMDILRKEMKGDYAEEAAKMILSWKKGVVFLATGFFVAGYAETDGPSGTVFLALALKKLGYRPVIVTDDFTRGFFELKDIDTVYMPFDEGDDWCRKVLEKYKPVGLISIERCGKNSNRDYANMRGVSIAEKTARVDLLFEQAFGKIPTIGVGDGGNEIGMGNVASLIAEKLSLVPCVVKTDLLVIATVSNWGAYAITAYLEKLSGKNVFMSYEEVRDYIEETVKLGSVDGVLKEQIVSVDGFGMETEKEIIDALKEAV